MAQEYLVIGLETTNEVFRSELAGLLRGQEAFRLQSPEEIGTPPHLLILELDSNHEKTFAYIQNLLNAWPATEIFLTAPRMDPDILLTALRAGVKEFIPQPIKQEDFAQALSRCQQRFQQRRPEERARGQLINVMGSKGGVGTTTIAVNLAISLCQTYPHKSVVLVDLNPQFGDVALFLDLKPTYTFSDVVKNVDRLDMTLLAGVLGRHPSGLLVLPSIQEIEEVGLLTPECVQATLALLQNAFDYVVVDSGHALENTTLVALQAASAIFLVSTLVLPVVWNTRRLLELFAQVDVAPNTVRLVINRYNSKNRELTLQDCENTLKQKAFWLVPNDYLATLSSINTGKPVVIAARKSKISKNLGKLAVTIGGEVRKPAFFARWSRSQARKV